MKKIMTLVVMLALAMPTLWAQEGEENETQEQQAQEKQTREKQDRNPGEVRTLFDPHSGSGGYGAFSIGYTKINAQDALLIGGRGEWVVGHGFGLGLGGYGFLNDATTIPPTS
jgi:opacity protein-like surface antigen